MAIYQIDEWCFEYKNKVYSFDIGRDETYIVYLSDIRIEEKDFIKHISKITVEIENILYILDDIVQNGIIHTTGV